jgi:uncharacterized protein YjdB
MRSSFTVSVLALFACACVEGKPLTSPADSDQSSTSPTSPTVSAISVSPTSIAGVPGQSDALSATVLNQNGQTVDSASITWGSSDTTIATVSTNGVVTLVAAGTANITATVGHLQARVPTTVSKKVIRVTAISVSPSTVSLYPGSTSPLSAIAKDSVNQAVTGQSISWTSSNTKVATVSASGIVTAIAIGSAVISAQVGTSAGTVTGTANISVVQAPVTAVSVSPKTVSTTIGAKSQLTATATTASGTVVTNVTPTWSSNNTAAATVSSTGMVTGVSAGTATVTVSVSGLTATASVSVAGAAPAAVASVTVSPATVTLAVGATQQATATDKTSSGATTTGTATTWATSNTGVATVSSSGVVTGVSAGTATIFGTSSGEYGTMAVTVTSTTSTPSPSSAAWPNQPSGMTEFTNRPYSATVEDGWESDFIGQSYIMSDGTSPQSAPDFFRIIYPVGLTGGSTPFQQEKALPGGQTQTYAEMWIRYSANWVPDNADVMKVLYIWDDDSQAGEQPAVCFCTTEGGAGASFMPQLRIQDNVTGTASNYSPNTGSAQTFEPNTWVHLEVYLKMNTPGGGNGVYKLWMNGQLISNYTNITYASTVYTSSQRHWYEFQLAPYWGGGGGTVASNQWMDIDHLYGSAAP